MVAIKDADFSDVDAVFCCLPHGTTQVVYSFLYILDPFLLYWIPSSQIEMYMLDFLFAGNYQRPSKEFKDCWSVCCMLWVTLLRLWFGCSHSTVYLKHEVFLIIKFMGWFRTSVYKIYLSMKNGMVRHIERRICRYVDYCTCISILYGYTKYHLASLLK